MTFLATLFVGVAQGLALGVAVSLLVFIARTARPHVVEVGRVKGTARYRNVERWATRTDDRIALLRMDGPLYFANARFFEDRAQGLVSDRPLIEHLIVVASAIGDIDASGTELLIDLDEELRDGGVQLHLVTVRGPVRDTLANTALWDQIATVAVQPGAPQAAGLVDGVPFLGLPGNPVAAMVSFAVFVRPLVQTLRGLAVESGGSWSSSRHPSSRTGRRRASCRRDGLSWTTGGWPCRTVGRAATWWRVWPTPICCSR